MKQPCVYMFANRRNGTIYVGVTSNPPRRAFEHHEGLVKGFSSKYGCLAFTLAMLLAPDLELAAPGSAADAGEVKLEGAMALF